MGHNYLGRLPTYPKWREVIALLDLTPHDVPAIASAVAEAADHRLIQLANDQGLVYSFWLLVRITQAARSQDFIGSLARLNVAVSPNNSTLQFISSVADTVRTELSRKSSSGDFSEIGSLALRTTLTNTVGVQGHSLFGSSVDDLKGAFAIYSTQNKFGSLSHLFFSDFFARVIRSYVDRELANHVGKPTGYANLAESKAFLDALDIHTRQSARIVERFAGAWYSKHNWETKGEITQEETQRFVAYALKKLRKQLKQQAGTT